MDRKTQRITSLFPGLLSDKSFKLTSLATRDYNCIAWACDKKDCWMWPNTDNHICDADEYWPDGVPNDETLESFIKAYATIGFDVTENDKEEQGYEKIALNVSPQANTVTHAARQLPNGLWTSKLSFWEDIQHGTPQSLEGDLYGYVKCYMKRKLK